MFNQKKYSHESDNLISAIRRVISLLLLVIICAINISCGNDCDDSEIEPAIDEYYVKYELNSSTIYSGGKLDVTITDDDGSNLELVVNQRVLWETIIGPFEKGFIAKLKAEAQSNTFDRLTLYSNIYVSKNGAPFALKEINGSDEPRDAIQIEYTITE